MRIIIVLGVWLAFACAGNAVEPDGIRLQANGLTRKPVALTVGTDRGDYGRTDHVHLRVGLHNSTAARLYVRRYAGWGESSSVSIWMVDAASDKVVDSGFLADEIDMPIESDDQLAPVEAGGGIFWNFQLPLAQYPLRPGRSYKVLVQYHSNRAIATSIGGVRTVTGQIKAEAFSPPFVVR